VKYFDTYRLHYIAFVPVNTEDELEQLAQILNDGAVRRRLVSAVYWLMNVVLVDSMLQLTSSCVR